LSQEVGLTKILWDPTAPVFYTGGLDGVIRVIDARSCKLERVLGRHRAEVLDLAITKLVAIRCYYCILLFPYVLNRYVIISKLL